MTLLLPKQWNTAPVHTKENDGTCSTIADGWLSFLATGRATREIQLPKAMWNVDTSISIFLSRISMSESFLGNFRVRACNKCACAHCSRVVAEGDVQRIIANTCIQVTAKAASLFAVYRQDVFTRNADAATWETESQRRRKARSTRNRGVQFLRSARD